MRNEFAKEEIGTSLFSGRKSQAGNCCSLNPGVGVRLPARQRGLTAYTFTLAAKSFTS
jgi:hypothetical protein